MIFTHSVHCWISKARNSARYLMVNEEILKTTIGMIVRPILYTRKLMVREVDYLAQDGMKRKWQLQDRDLGTLVLELILWITVLNSTAFCKKCIFWPIRRFKEEGQMGFWAWWLSLYLTSGLFMFMSKNRRGCESLWYIILERYTKVFLLFLIKSCWNEPAFCYCLSFN